jgi:hypothetical protein
MADRRPTRPGADADTPRWVKVSGVIALAVLLLFIILMLAGGSRHGPGRHLRSGHMDGQPPSRGD